MQKVNKSSFSLTIILLICLTILSYRFLNLWFIMDDSSCIYAATYKPLSLFFNRDMYLLFNKMFYTPLLPLSFKIDTFLFRLNPTGYHIHNLLAAFFTGLIGYNVYRIYMPRFESWAGTFFFVLSYPVITNIGWITRRHYIWGTLFFLYSFYLFKKYEIHRKSIYLLISNICYLITILFKEAFAPLPAIIFLMARGNLRQRFLFSLPYLAILSGVLLLRMYILGGLGGYIGIKLSINPIEIMDNYKTLLTFFSLSIWGLKPIFILPFFFLLILLKRSIGLLIITVFLILTSPFLLIKIPHTVDDYYLFYLPSKLMLPLFIFSGMLAFLIYNLKNIKLKMMMSSIVILLFGLQIFHAQQAYSFIKKSSEHYKSFTLKALQMNRNGNGIIIVDSDAIFYNYFYESYLNLISSKEKSYGIATTFDDPVIISLLKEEYLGKIDFVYINRKWVNFENINSGLSIINEWIQKPQVIIKKRDNFVSFTVTDKREGTFYGILKTIFSDKNIGLQSMVLPKNIPLTLGLTKGKERIYIFYCIKGNCSNPITINSL